MGRLRVLSVINALNFGGAESRLLSLSKSINRERFEHIVLTLKKPDVEFETRLGSYRPSFAAAGIVVVDLGDTSPGLGRATGSIGKVARSAPRLVRVLFRLARFIRERGVDVIDAHIGTANQLGAAASLLTRVPVVLTTYQQEQRKPAWLWELSERVAFTVASAIVTDSDPVAELVRRKVLRPRPVPVIPNGIEPPPSVRSSRDMRTEFGIPTDPGIHVIGQVSSLTPRKGHLTLLDAAARVLAEDSSAWFLLCGYERVAGLADTLRARARELGIAERVKFVSYPGPIGDVYRAIDIQVHASTGESLPQAIIEGMSLGKPLVVTGIAGIPAMLVDGESGFVVPPADAHALALALLRVIREPELARAMGSAARERYTRGPYSQDRMTRALEVIFENVARPRGRAPRELDKTRHLWT